MPVNEITTIITTVGFPIFCVIALGWFIYTSYKMIVSRNKEREEKLYGIISENQEQLKELGKTNASFIEILNHMKEDLINVRNDIDDIKDKMGEQEND